ncbi:phage portal protein [Brucella tritici]|uniref:Phage portal protein n=2 Tax=Brucella tritici TaxID=94626 RepID=A0A833CND0_9HYPH|nr:phage portal protein [Brucella tritici]KAB2666535.1 phage portal protein [Brucella tritici]
MSFLQKTLNVFRLGGSSNPSFEAAGRGRRLRGFNPPRRHVNAAIQQAGTTLTSRARWLYQNDGYAGNAIDEWASAAVGDGIKPRPRIKNKKLKRFLVDLFYRWSEEADIDGLHDYYGIQEMVAREVFLCGEVFVRIHARHPDDMWTVPFQLQVMPAEMLDLSYDMPLTGGRYIRAGIEFDSNGRRLAYHFWRYHPDDAVPIGFTGNLRERVRVPAEEVIHVLEAREGGQIRGVPRVARILVKIFKMEFYDDAELERKGTTALFAGFTKGRGEPPLDLDDDDEDDTAIAPMTPGAIIDLGDDRDITFSQPADVGGSYEPFQYRSILKISAGLGVPYSYVSGDMTKGNFSNVRTDIVRFRRRVGQWTNNTLNFQLCREVWKQFVDRAYMAGLVELPNYDNDPTLYWSAEHLPPRQEWIDPRVDVMAEKESIKAGLKSRTQAVAERGYDREDIDEELAEERAAARGKGLRFDTDAPEPGSESGWGSATALLPEERQDRPEEREDNEEEEQENA